MIDNNEAKIAFRNAVHSPEDPVHILGSGENRGILINKISLGNIWNSAVYDVEQFVKVPLDNKLVDGQITDIQITMVKITPERSEYYAALKTYLENTSMEHKDMLSILARKRHYVILSFKQYNILVDTDNYQYSEEDILQCNQ